MSWKLSAALVAGLIAGPTFASDLFQMPRPAKGGRFAYGLPYRGDRRYDLGIGIGLELPPDYLAPYFGPPGYDSPPPVSAPPVSSYSTPAGVGVTVYSLPEGNVTYSVTRPPPPGAELVPVPPVPRDATFPYDGGPADPVPMPRAEPDAAAAPRYFHMPPRAAVEVSLPMPTKSRFAYPAYGDGADRAAADRDRVIIIKDGKKANR